MFNSVFITGTGTDVGKTYISALLVKKMRELSLDVVYYKAAMSGNIRDERGILIPGDAEYVKSISGILQPLKEMCPYVYENACSPHLAAIVENMPVEFNRVIEGYKELGAVHDYVVMEGSGGITCPLRFDSERFGLPELVKELQLSSIIVADAGLGTINSVVLTHEYMKNHGMPVKGIIFNNYHAERIMERDNVKMCEYMTGLPVIACVEENAKDIDISEKMIKNIFNREVL